MNYFFDMKNVRVTYEEYNNLVISMSKKGRKGFDRRQCDLKRNRENVF